VAAHDHPDDDGSRLRDAAASALGSTHRGDESAAVNELIDFLASSPDGRGDARDLVLLLFSECSGMVTALGATEQTTGVKMQVFDTDGQELSIDDAEPAVRTAVRTLLAEVHGDSEAARDQIEIALSNADPSELATVVLQALRWTVRLSEECGSRELPVPPWISSALGEGTE
jgi:hypothetical protein